MSLDAGLTFGDVADSLRTVVDNGVDIDDARVMRRANEATQELLLATDPRTGGQLVPVGCFMEAQLITDSSGSFLLPVEMENVIYVARTDNALDSGEGQYTITAPATYFESVLSHDVSLMDFGFVRESVASDVLRRRFRYPPLPWPAPLLLRGKRRYAPITADTDYLIIQNLPALKLMCQAIERRENRVDGMDDATKYKNEAIKMLSDECVNHISDPMRMASRIRDYETDLETHNQGTMGWIRARLALEIPAAMAMGRDDLARLMDRAEMRALAMGTWKNCMEEFDATVYGGTIYFPSRVESVLALNIDGVAAPVRSIFYKYLEAGPGSWDCTCGGRLEDMGEEILPGAAGRPRRKFRFNGSITEGSCLLAICKLRWIKKVPADYMLIRNLEAMRLLCEGVMTNDNKKLMEARALLDDELKQYLRGIKHTMPAAALGVGFEDLGAMV